MSLAVNQQQFGGFVLAAACTLLNFKGPMLAAIVAVAVCSPPAAAQVPPAKPAENPRDVFKLFGMDDPFFGSFVEDEPFSPDEQQKLWKVLLRTRGFSLVDMQRWARRGDQWQAMVADPITYRGEVLAISGRATKVSRVPLDEDTIAKFEMDKLYRVQLVADDGSQVTLYTPVVPNAWLERDDLNEPASALGVLVKRAADDAAPPADAQTAEADKPPDQSPGRLVFAAPRVAWHPQNVLGQLGMDEGLFDTVQNRRPILAAERECFYQLLAAAGRTQPFQLEREAFAQLARLRDNLSRNRSAFAGNGPRQQQMQRQLARAERKLYDVVPLFNQPESQTGRLVMFEGDIRRAVEIPVDDADVRQRFGIERYYELAMFTDDSQSNPLICCVLEVPPELPLGEDIFMRGRVAGFFMKSWAYPRGNGTPAAEPNKVKQQLAPLILGRDVRVFLRQPTWSDRLSGAGAVAAVVMALVGILWGAWYTTRTPRRAAPTGEATPAPPDFSALD
jgi:hypothetical protein